MTPRTIKQDGFIDYDEFTGAEVIIVGIICLIVLLLLQWLFWRISL
jgi:hypothetical protein